MSDENKIKPQKNVVIDTLDSLAVAFVIAMIIRTFLVGAYKIPSGSMLETLQIGDHILVNKMSYAFSEPKNGDIVVFEFPLEPDKDYIKRIIGIPGDKIEILDKVIYRNGEKLEEPYVEFESMSILPADISPKDNIAEFIVPENSYFMMGDNRDASYDSRFWGFVDEEAIVGKAFVIYFSSGNNGIRFNRIFDTIK